MLFTSSRKCQLNGFMALAFVSQVFLLSAHHVLSQENYYFCTTHSSHGNPHIYVPKGGAVQLKGGRNMRLKLTCILSGTQKKTTHITF